MGISLNTGDSLLNLMSAPGREQILILPFRKKTSTEVRAGRIRPDRHTSAIEFNLLQESIWCPRPESNRHDRFQSRDFLTTSAFAANLLPEQSAVRGLEHAFTLAPRVTVLP